MHRNHSTLLNLLALKLNLKLTEGFIQVQGNGQDNTAATLFNLPDRDPALSDWVMFPLLSSKWGEFSRVLDNFSSDGEDNVCK